MKKGLLFASLFLTTIGNAQSLTQANEPQIGANITMYVCDSAFADFASTNGNGVTWNFAAITGYSGIPSKNISVAAPSDNSFSPATKVTSIDGFISTYWTSSSTDRTSQGFVYTDVTVGDVEVKFATDNEKIANYPFALTNTFTDSYSGTLYNGTITASGAVPCTGTATAIIDGQGTLVLPGNITLPNVIRYKVTENSSATITFSGFPIPVGVNRVQYDYYDINNSALPVFSHIQLNVTQNSSPINSTTLVLSTVEPTLLASIAENSKNNFAVYPNPTQGKVTVKGDFAAGASLVVMDQTGRIVTSLESVNNGSTIDLSNVQKGMYSVVITNNGSRTIKTISVN